MPAIETYSLFLCTKWLAVDSSMMSGNDLVDRAGCRFVSLEDDCKTSRRKVTAYGIDEFMIEYIDERNVS